MRPRKEFTYKRTRKGCIEVKCYSLDRCGYPTVRRNNKLHRLYRYAYELWHGPIPPGLVVRHTCDNSLCIARRHLILGTVKENNQDRDSRGRTAHAEQSGSAKLNR